MCDADGANVVAIKDDDNPDPDNPDPDNPDPDVLIGATGIPIDGGPIVYIYI
jgi:hypothetical protein